MPAWYTYTKNWYLVRQAKKHGEKVKDRSAEVVHKTTDFVTETTDLVVDAIQDATEGLVDTLQDIPSSFQDATDSLKGSILGSDSSQASDDESITAPKHTRASNEGPNGGSKDTPVPLEVTPPATPHEDSVHAHDSPSDMGINAEVTPPTSPKDLDDSTKESDVNATDATPPASPLKDSSSVGGSYIGDIHASEMKSVTSPNESINKSLKDTDARAHLSQKLVDDKSKKASTYSTKVTSSLSNSSMNGGIRVDPTTLGDYSTSIRNSFESKLANQEEDLAQRLKTSTTDGRRSVGFRPPLESRMSETMKASNITLKASNIMSESERVKRATFLPDQSAQIEDPAPGQRRLPRRSIMLRDYQDKFGNSIVAGIASGPKNADDFNDEQEIENNQKWKWVASRIDDVARFWIPLAYIIALAIILAEVQVF